MRSASYAVLFLILCAVRVAAEPLADEARRRNDELVKQGFNLTRGWTATTAVTRFEMLVPPAESTEHIIVLWFEAAFAAAMH